VVLFTGFTASGLLGSSLKRSKIYKANFMAAFWAEFTFGGSGPAITAHGSLDLKQEMQIQIYKARQTLMFHSATEKCCSSFATVGRLNADLEKMKPAIYPFYLMLMTLGLS
jgi:hypothetical protein